MSLGRRLTAEGLGTAFLLAAVVGPGIMGERGAVAARTLFRWLRPELPVQDVLVPHGDARDP